MSAAWVATSLLFFAVITHAETAKTAKKPPTVPFDTFQSIDKKLSVLDVQLTWMDALLQKAASGAIATSSGKGGRQPWTASSQQMLTNVRSLEKTAAKLQQHYKNSAAGKALITPLLKSADAIEKSTARMAASKNAAQARSTMEEVRRSRIDFLLKFHALSANYGALRCERGRWACCEIAHQNGAASCRWSCVQTVRQCSKGLLGPRSQSASADVVRH